MRQALEWAQHRYLDTCQMYQRLGRLAIPETGGGFVDGIRIQERVDIWTGKDGWSNARAQYQDPPQDILAEWLHDADFWRRFACRPAVVLPPGDHPEEYRWQDMARPWVRPVIIDTGDTGRDALEILALVLIEEGAPGVRVYRINGEPGMVIGELANG
jgi:hypothetical protein